MTIRSRNIALGVALLGALAALLLLASLPSEAHAKPAVTCNSPNAFQFNPHPAAAVDPLTGANFFLDGPGTNHGLAASAMAQQVGENPDGYGNISWPAFLAHINRLSLSAGVAHRVNLLEKIGAQPEAKRISRYTAGGGPGAIYTQLRKLLCRIHQTDPNANALLSTYFLLHGGACSSDREVGSEAAAFRRRISEFARAIGTFPTTILLESDQMDTSPCLGSAGLAEREQALTYAINTLSKLPHSIVYVDGGTSDAVSVSFSARVLNKIGIRKIRGFFLNATHFNWSINEIQYGEKISRLTGGAHFIVGTHANGRGPLKNPHPVTQGNENLCNPPGRGLGRRFTTDTGYFQDHLDAFMWVSTPGKSAGHCGIGTAPGGIFDLNVALTLAKNANDQLGPHFPSQPY